MPNKIPTAHHQQQDDQQRGHEHQQGQPDVVPHLGADGARAEAGREAPLSPHRSGEPGTRRPETTAAAGCASMADTTRLWTGKRASTGTRGDHTAFVAARPSSILPSRTAGNVSWKPLQLLLSPRPPPPAAAHHRQPPPPARPPAAWGQLGDGVLSLVEV